MIFISNLLQEKEVNLLYFKSVEIHFLARIGSGPKVATTATNRGYLHSQLISCYLGSVISIDFNPH